MCGIAGFFGNGNLEKLEKMTSKLQHRGPDSEGFFVEKNIGLGHRRLSILDLSENGTQPMQRGSSIIAFNGEIYNFKEIRAELEGSGTVFESNTDTEVILHLYNKIGTKCFSKLNGMFAIAIYDKSKNKLILVRDRLGKKPLYWGVFNNTLVFGSEIKAIAEHPEFKKELSLESLNKYLQFEYVPTPNTMFKNLYKLEPASFLEFDGKTTRKEVFWEMDFSKRKNIGISDAVSKLDSELDKAVNSRLISDVPLGVFLSGGIDSSLIAYYAQKNSSESIKTFSIGFKEKSFDETEKAELVSKHLKTDHYKHILSAKDCLDVIPEIYSSLDEPMADPSIIPTYLLSKFAKENISVALGGDGGDELFCGYDTFVAEKFVKIYNLIPKLLQKQIAYNLSGLLPTSFKNISLDFKIKKFSRGMLDNSKYRHQNWLGSFDKQERQSLFSDKAIAKLGNKNEFKEIDAYTKSTNSDDKIDELIHLYLRTYMMDDILVKVDRTSMMNSLEVRTPLLDYKLVELVNSIPNNFKIKGLNTKYLLKKLASGKLPGEIINQKKKGFGIPLANWLNNELKPLCDELLNRKKIEEEGIFNPSYIDNLLEQHQNKKSDNRKLIWTLLVFQMWKKNWF